MDLQLNQSIAFERIELIARLVATQVDNVRARDREVAISLIDELSAAFRVSLEGDSFEKKRSVTTTCICCVKPPG